MTPEGHALLTAYLKDLKEVQRPANVRAIEEARAHGDLKENAEYQYAKEKQVWITTQIAITESKLARAQIVDPKTITQSRIAFGATVTVLDLETEEEVTYKFVGSDEADVTRGLLSFDSPLARAMVGKEEGDDVSFQAPRGLRRFEIIEVVYK